MCDQKYNTSRQPIFLNKKTNSNVLLSRRVTIQTDIPPSSEKENTKVKRKKRCRAPPKSFIDDQK